MTQRLNKSLDKLSEYLAPRKGLLPLIGIFFVIINFILQFFAAGWVSHTNLFLHLGVVIAIFGLLLAWAL
jgi:capsular polysaccharide biosynthesis protein